MTLLLVVLALFLAALLWLALRLKKQVVKEQQLREEAESSKLQIIVEQERNRQLKQEMTNNIAHELKTPVSSIRGFLEILQGDKPLTEEQRKYFLNRCYSQTLRLSNLLRDVTLINKLEEADDLFDRETVDLREVAEESILELRLNADQQQIDICDELPSGMRVEGNEMLLYSIFRNLIENAVVHAGQGVRIVIEPCEGEDSSHYYIRLYDTGKGVDDQYIPRLFDRFVRIDEGRSRKNGGTGLGLSIVKHAVLFHGGDICVRNREQGGLEFFFSIEKLPHRASPAESAR